MSTEPFGRYEDYDAVGLAALVATGEVKSVELVEAAIVRAEAVNPALNAIIVEQYDRARRTAADAPGDGPFGGVPFLIKDLALVAGDPATFGSVFFRDYVADVTEEYMRRALGAGFIPIGRSASPEFGLLPTTEPTLYGATRNPWNLEYSSGGSSGGTAVAVASGIVPLAHGSDGGGSIRIPASACGVFGFKPTRGRMPRHPASPADYLSVDLGLSRSVRDVATLLDVTHGAMPGAEYNAPEVGAPFADAVGIDPAPLTVGFAVTDFRGDEVHPECAAAVRRTATLLEGMGHRVVEAGPDVDGQSMAEAFLVVWESLAEAVFSAILDEVENRRGGKLLRRLLGDKRAMQVVARLDRRKSGRDAFERFTWKLADLSRRQTPARLGAARTELQNVSYQVGAFLEEHDAYLTPTLAAPPLRLGAIDQSAAWDDIVEQLFTYVAFTPIANFSGLPAMSVPLHWTAGDLPVGSHFMGRFGDDAALLALAGQLERAQPWWDRRPELPQSPPSRAA